MNEKENKNTNNNWENEVVEGRNSVFEAIKSGRTINKILITKEESDYTLTRIIAAAKERKIVVQKVNRVKLDNKSTTRAHQGVIALVSPKEYVTVDDILENAKQKGEAPLIVMLDGITDNNNLGSILRSADCTGVHGIIIPKRRSAGLNSIVAKVSAGAVEYVPVARVTNLTSTIQELKEKGFWIAGTDINADQTFYEADLKGSLCIIIGSEGEGISKRVKDNCDFVVKIPMKGDIASFNAGVAAGIVMYEAMRQRS